MNRFLQLVGIRGTSKIVANSIVIPILFVLSGCVSADFSGPTTSFQKGVNSSASAIGTYLVNLNQFERQLYLDERAYDPSLEVLAKDQTGAKTPLLGQYFTPESIRARTDALALVGSFAQELSELAGSTAPNQLATDFNQLGDNLTKLGSTFDALSSRNDKTAISYVGPVSGILGALGKIYLNHERSQSIRIAIEEGAPHVEKILKLIENDLSEVVKPLQQTGIQQQLATRISYYNSHRNRAPVEDFSTLQQRKLALSDITAAADAYEAIVAFNPSNLVGSIRKSLDALLIYAKSSHEPRSFADMIAALQALQQNAQELEIQAHKIHQLIKG